MTDKITKSGNIGTSASGECFSTQFLELVCTGFNIPIFGRLIIFRVSIFFLIQVLSNELRHVLGAEFFHLLKAHDSEFERPHGKGCKEPEMYIPVPGQLIRRY